MATGQSRKNPGCQFVAFTSLDAWLLPIFICSDGMSAYVHNDLLMGAGKTWIFSSSYLGVCCVSGVLVCRRHYGLQSTHGLWSCIRCKNLCWCNCEMHEGLQGTRAIWSWKFPLQYPLLVHLWNSLTLTLAKHLCNLIFEVSVAISFAGRIKACKALVCFDLWWQKNCFWHHF